MRVFALLLIVLGVLTLSGCESPERGTYPLSGQPCSPNDPVHDLSGNCLPPL
ncbi:MAG: hypothetical protein KGK00_02440 [Paracoccaceae bacterium]|nr:hypothetical protein [Paracoccaceae bacterium]MDE3239536.1 hypothetical protein [Paracoccaceae bacterium]